MTAADEWLKENAIECTRYRLRLSPHACQACQRATPERCEGCERTKERPQLTPRQAQHVRGALNGAKTRRTKKMAKEKETTVGATHASPETQATEDDQGAVCCSTPMERNIHNRGQWRSGLRQTLRELAGEAVLMGDDPRVVRLVKCCYYLAGELEVRNPGAYPEIEANAGKMLGR